MKCAWLWVVLSGCAGRVTPEVVHAPLVTAPWQIEGDTGEGLGTAVANAGDVDGDGFDDLIIGAPSYGPLFANEGRVVVWRGGAHGFGAFWTVSGLQAGAMFGSIVAGVGDVDGDGFADVAIGAPDYDALASDDGGVWVYFGGLDSFTRTPWFNQGAAAGARFGAQIAAGDIDGDGFTELVVSETGRVLVFAGGVGGPSVTPRVLPATAAAIVFAGDVDGDGFGDFLLGDGEGFGLWRGRSDGRLEAEVGRFVGTRAQRIGDVDGDGFGDFAVGSAGMVTTYFGATPGPIEAGYEVRRGGRALAAADVDGDGIVDLVTSTDAGAASEVIVYAGRGQREVEPWRVTGCPDCASDVGFGAAIAAGDFNGDGRGDVAVASPGFAAGRGRVAVQLGKAALLAATPDLEVELGAEGDGKVAFVGDCAAVGFEMFVACSPGALGGAGDYWHWMGEEGGIAPSPYGALARGQRGYGRAVAGRGDIDHDGYGEIVVAQGTGPEYTVMAYTLGFQPRPEYWLGGTPGDELGASVALDGDVDGDGIVDILVGAPGAGTTLDLVAPGEVQVTFPRLIADGPFAMTRVVVPATPDWRARGTIANGDFGRVTTFAGDLDGDGRAEIVVGLPLANRIALYRSGDAGPSPVLDAPRGAGRFGASVVAGDVDGDGLGDLVVGAPGDGQERGRIHLFYGDRDAVLTPGVVLVGEPGSRFGAAVATGDIDGDGFADVVIGAPGEARVHVFRGRAEGAETEAAVVIDGPEVDFGREVAGGGDVDSDGYGDIAVVSRAHAYVFRGNAGVSRRSFRPVARTSGHHRRIAPWSSNNVPNAFAVTMQPARLETRVGVRLELEVKRHDVPFDGVVSVTGAWQETLDAMRVAAAGLTAKTAYHWRGRIAFRPSDVPLQGRLPWLWGGTNGQAHAVHLRTRTNVAPETNDDVTFCERDLVCTGAGLLANDRDGDDDALSTIATTIVTARGGAVVVGQSGDFSYTPPAGWVGIDTFEYEASDGVGGRTIGTVTVSVVESGCRAAAESCLGGQWTGVLDVGGQRRGFRCAITNSGGEPRLRCDTDARGELRLDAVVCE